MQFLSIASGSTGNSYYLGNEHTGILIDAGISAARIEKALAEKLNKTVSNLSGILVTHEHNDHITSIGTLARRHKIPVFASAGTWLGMEEKIGNIDPALRRVISSNGHFNLDALDIEHFSIPHDSNEPLGFVIHSKEKRIAFATDIGKFEEQIHQKFHNADMILIEANHDEQMLMRGKYPQFLKQRILSPHGHLSNIACGCALTGLIGGNTKHVMLAHLSKENNQPVLAHKTVKDILLSSNTLRGSISLWVAKMEECSTLINL